MNHSLPLVTLEHVSVMRGGRSILTDINLRLERGSYTTIVGPNGAGKTTLVQLVLGLLKAKSGTLNRAAGLKVGYVPQRLPVDAIFPVTVKRFMQLSLRSSDAADIAAQLQEVGMQDKANRLIHTLSGGELQRVLLARALLGSPDILVLDEPVQHLDIRGQLEFYSLLGRIFEMRHCAVLMVSHDLHMVMAQTNEVICLFHHICCSGKPQSLKENPEFIKLFGADMLRLLAVYEHTHDHSHTHDGGHAESPGHLHGEQCRHD